MGAGVLVDAADAVVAGTGKFEELMVCSQEVAASTVQLVVASKVICPISLKPGSTAYFKG
jgi:huntingtin interacting protein 1